MNPAAAAIGLLDLLPDAVLELDASQRIILANRQAMSLTGYTPSELFGNHCGHLLQPRRPDGSRLWDEMRWHRSADLPGVAAFPQQEVLLRRADGDDVTTFVAGRYRRDPDRRLEGAFLVLRVAPASGRRRQASPGSGTGLEILSTVSHELRSPLTSVKGYTTLLLNRWDVVADDDKRSMLKQIRDDADRITRLITELLDVGRLETGRVVLHRQAVAVPEVAAAVVEKATLRDPAVQVEMQFARDLPQVTADRDKVEQVLTNLVENAGKYASGQGIRIGGEVRGDDLAVWVSDVGEGIPASELSQVFTKFFRGAEARPSGSGLGLWISRGLVEAHGGTMTAESVEGRGSTFCFTLPLTPSQANGASEQP